MSDVTDAPVSRRSYRTGRVGLVALAIVGLSSALGWLYLRAGDGPASSVLGSTAPTAGDPKVATPAEAPDAAAMKAPAPEPRFADLAARGKWLFKNKACGACHGPDGRGGVPNPNSIQGTVPSLAELPDRLMLFDEEDAKLVVERLESGETPNADEQPPPFRTWPRFVAQYNAVQGVVRDGNPAGRKDPGGPPPPLNMPAWKGQLSARDVDAIIAWLLQSYDWEDED